MCLNAVNTPVLGSEIRFFFGAILIQVYSSGNSATAYYLDQIGTFAFREFNSTQRYAGHLHSCNNHARDCPMERFDASQSMCTEMYANEVNAKS